VSSTNVRSPWSGHSRAELIETAEHYHALSRRMFEERELLRAEVETLRSELREVATFKDRLVTNRRGAMTGRSRYGR
jgi:hypothetical protein